MGNAAYVQTPEGTLVVRPMHVAEVDVEDPPPAGPAEDHADIDSLLLKGRQGEAILEAKAANSDSTAVLSGFILAFSLGVLLELDPSNFSNEFLGILFGLSMCASAGCGLGCVLLLTFLSSKLRRLIGKSTFFWGTDPDGGALRAAHGEKKVAEKIHAAQENNSVGEVRFAARDWYYTADNKPGLAGREHFVSAVRYFMVQVVTFAIAALVYIADVMNVWVAAVSILLVITPPLYAISQLYLTGAMRHLA
mmetsp:Transcript_106821/g.309935  ORF Transcript_106821/g.309935 Transcript_106821/m.309935 type:complete len:250 (+) Transcript_106821:165-914(+)